MRGIARTDRLVRLVMWGALLTAAWILFSPGRASASEHPVGDVVRSVSSLTGSVLDRTAQGRPAGASNASAALPTGGSSSTAHRPGASSPGAPPAEEAPAKAAATGSPRAGAGHAPRWHETGAPSVRETGDAPVRVLAEVPKSLPHNAIRALTSESSPSGLGSDLRPVVAATTQTVRAVVGEAVETATATVDVVPGLDRPVRDVTDVVVDVVDALPVVGTRPVVELPLPGLVPPSSSSPSTPSAEPVPDLASPVRPVGAGDRHEDLAAPASRVSGLRPLIDVTAEPASSGPAVGQADQGRAAPRPAPSTGADATDPSLPWPGDLPAPVAPVPAPSFAGGAGQQHGADVQADLPPTTSSTRAAGPGFDGNDVRAPGALNARPGLRPD